MTDDAKTGSAADAAAFEDAKFQDAKFQDGEKPVRLRAETAEDLVVVAALLQDAVGKVADAAWLPKRRRFSLVLNRFRWEDSANVGRGRRPFERVFTGMTVSDVASVKAKGIDPAARDQVLSLLQIAFEPGEDGAGVVRLVLSGGAELALEVECLDVAIEDLSRPWETSSAPEHPED